jgi:DNA-binding SARP family transcriptional activator
VWALLAYLLLTEVPPARQVLASLLFPEADDLLRSLRWTVSELRRVLPHLPTLAGDPLRISLPEDTTVDVLVLTTGKWSEAVG